jgi:CRP-like cAMP-binding protein
METSNRLHEILYTAHISAVSLKKYKMGDNIPLIDSVAWVIDGVVGCDGYHPAKDVFVTIRLAANGSMLNLENVFSKGGEARKYVCETPVAVIAVMSIADFKAIVKKDNLLANVVAEIHDHSVTAVETTLGVSHGTASDKVMWAIQRYKKITKCADIIPMLKIRIAAHTGIAPESVSRALKQLVCQGEITTKTNISVTLKEAS